VPIKIARNKSYNILFFKFGVYVQNFFTITMGGKGKEIMNINSKLISQNIRYFIHGYFYWHIGNII